mgnify:CR=1 FL=1
MAIKYLKKSPKTPSTDDTKTTEIVKGLLKDIEINKEQAEEFGELTKLAMRKTQERLGVKCPLDSEYKIGRNWSETH